MDVKIRGLNNREQTGNEIKRLAKKYKSDLLPYKNYSLQAFYDIVHSIPYEKDPVHTEIVSRPAYLLDRGLFPAIDCKKKAVLLAAFFELQGWKYILVAVSESQHEVHHVFLMLFNGLDWVPVDATLKTDWLYKPKPEIVHGYIL